MKRLVPYALGAVIGGLLIYAVMPEPEPLHTFEVVRITPAQMDAIEPDTERSIGERITTRRVEPAAVAIAEDSTRAAEFVRLYVSHSVQQDTARRLALPVTGPSALLGYAGRLDGVLELYSVGTDRTRRRHVFEADCQPLEWVYDGADVYVSEGRWCWAQDALGALGVGALGYGLGSGQWEFIAGGAVSLAIRRLIF